MPCPHPAAGVLAVTAVNPVHYVHAFNDLSEGSECGLAVVARGVVAGIDVHLRGTCVRSGIGKGDKAAGVVLCEWGMRIIRNGRVAPLLRNVRLSVDTKLHPAS